MERVFKKPRIGGVQLDDDSWGNVKSFLIDMEWALPFCKAFQICASRDKQWVIALSDYCFSMRVIADKARMRHNSDFHLSQGGRSLWTIWTQKELDNLRLARLHWLLKQEDTYQK